MGLNCDFCGRSIDNSEMNVLWSASVLAAVSAGFTPSRLPKETEEFLRLGDVDRQEWFKQTAAETTDLQWGLCNDCHIDFSAFDYDSRPDNSQQTRSSAAAYKHAQQTPYVSLVTNDLARAVLLGESDAVFRALESGADPDHKFRTGKPLIHVAASKGFVDIARQLIIANADLTLTFKGLTPVQTIEKLIGEHSGQSSPPSKEDLNKTLAVISRALSAQTAPRNVETEKQPATEKANTGPERSWWKIWAR